MLMSLAPGYGSGSFRRAECQVLLRLRCFSRTG